jgi:two-component system, sensor histidine kinase PdtaS
MTELAYQSETAADIELRPPQHRVVAGYEVELARLRHSEFLLREAVAQAEDRLRDKDALIKHQQLLSREADHRLLNELQMIASVLSLKSRESLHAEVAGQLAAAADRVATIGGIHRRLRYHEDTRTVAFMPFLEGLCGDLSKMLTAQRSIVVEGIEANLPTATAIPLGFIVTELITNAAKHGDGAITAELQPNAERSYALSVTNGGRQLPEDFDPAASKGMGMTLIRTFVEQIRGELRIARGDNTRGAQFTVLFA